MIAVYVCPLLSANVILLLWPGVRMANCYIKNTGFCLHYYDYK